MFAIILLAVFVMLAHESKSMAEDSSPCKEIRSSLEKTTKTYHTVCLDTESLISSDCCKNIEKNIKTRCHQYKKLCPIMSKPLTKDHCKIPLGVQHVKRIPHVAIASSTILNVNSLPHFGRLKNDQSRGCAWRPAKAADQDSSWLQVDLGSLTKVSGVATQGSCSSDEWTKSYVIMYSNDGVDWKEYKEDCIIKVFNGNKDRSSVVTNDFKYPFMARTVRILPKSWHINAALRIEFYTDKCHYKCPTSHFQPRSCLDHLKNGSKTNGYYNIYDASLNLVTVYCDMTSESGKAWTLVMSWATKNKNMAAFRSTPLSTNCPVDENFPNWGKYRMSLSIMNDLSTQSTHWRATCSFPTHGVDYVDYVRGKIVDFNVVTFMGTYSCQKVEYVNIRGHYCKNCTPTWWQNSKYMIHIDSAKKTCGVYDFYHGARNREDNFGYYVHINRAFRCTADDTATTNWWFGGSLT